MEFVLQLSFNLTIVVHSIELIATDISQPIDVSDAVLCTTKD